ncbi:hypothetical protein DL765_006872 [Monosporascus sp. GIB2]|nr:hypothetical protein DL765_006872 [Monosporascus sp. GIB2]
MIFDAWSSTLKTQQRYPDFPEKLPEIRNSSGDNHNKVDSFIVEGTIDIAIFTDDVALHQSVLNRLKEHAASKIYLNDDGPLPNPPEWLSKIYYYRTEASLAGPLLASVRPARP